MPKGKITGRPKLKFDPEGVQKLAAIGCTEQEIADFFSCSVDTIRRRRRDDADFCNALLKGKAEGKMSLRRSLFQAATEDGNVTAMIWLDKQWLGGRDKHDVEHSGNIDSTSTTITIDLSDKTDDELFAETERLRGILLRNAPSGFEGRN